MLLLTLLSTTTLLPARGAPMAPAASCVVRPGTLPLDTDGRPVHAHGAGIYQENGTLYLLGTSQNFPVLADASNPKSGTAYLSASINLYSTSRRAGGLCGWRFLGAVLARSTLEAAMTPSLGAGVTARMERPKLARASTGKYVIWVHVQSGVNSSYSNVAVAEAAALDGRSFQFASNFFANGLISKDSTVFTDVSRDGRSYFVRDTAHQCDSISPFTASGLGVGPLCSHTGPSSDPGICIKPYGGPGTSTKSHPPWLCEGVSMFRDPVDGRLFMFGSHLSGWRANGAMIFVSSERDVCSSNHTSWTYLGNPAVGEGNDTTFGAQVRLKQSTIAALWRRFLNYEGAGLGWLHCMR
jgi:hypothetical protein